MSHTGQSAAIAAVLFTAPAPIATPDCNIRARVFDILHPPVPFRGRKKMLI